MDLKELLESRNNIGFVNISYELAHNIIYSGVAFAEDYGFMPPRDFTSITSHFLELDNDDIPLIEIECGMDGKPCYTNTGHDSPERERTILAQLQRTAGEGNYHFMLPGSDDMYVDVDDDDDDDVDDDEYI